MAKKELKEIKEGKTWMPSLKWLCEIFLMIVFFVVIVFFILNFLLKPYMRNIPIEITPWLAKIVNTQSVQEQSK